MKDLIERIKFDLDLSLTDEDCKVLVSGLELLQKRFLLFAGEEYVNSYPSLDVAINAGAKLLDAEGYQVHLLDALTGTIVWSDKDHDQQTDRKDLSPHA